MKVIKKLPPQKFEYKWIRTDEYTFDTFEAKRLEVEEVEAKKENKGFLRRFYPALAKLLDMGDKNVIKTMHVDGFEYMLNYWTKRPEEAIIKKRVYWDILNNKIADIQPAQVGLA